MDGASRTSDCGTGGSGSCTGKDVGQVGRVGQVRRVRQVRRVGLGGARVKV